MRYLVALMATAAPALAHSGAHLHPHEANSVLPLIAGVGVIAGAAVLYALRRRAQKVRK